LGVQYNIDIELVTNEGRAGEVGVCAKATRETNNPKHHKINSVSHLQIKWLHRRCLLSSE